MAYVLFEVTQGAGILHLNHPETMNSLNEARLVELHDFFTKRPPGGISALILVGVGKAFVAGADIAAMATMTPKSAQSFSELGHSVMESIEAFPLPVIAAVNGHAIGGGLELALAADFIYLSDHAKVGLPELTLGLIPGFGGLDRLARRVGSSRARELVYSGQLLTASEALAVGLVNRVVPDVELLPACLAMAAKFAAVGPHSLRMAKKCFSGRENVPVRFGEVFATGEPHRGLSAFLSKKKVDWSSSGGEE